MMLTFANGSNVFDITQKNNIVQSTGHRGSLVVLDDCPYICTAFKPHIILYFLGKYVNLLKYGNTATTSKQYVQTFDRM